ncbi:MAG: FAD-dependent oxidoreductase [Spirochaetales bacterium]|nr:FAD-dependent oxidoreductase [Spirochaetales bacterium]
MRKQTVLNRDVSIYDAVVIGAGAAGMAAALTLAGKGVKTALIDREDHLGGILMQCIHNGFGIHEFKQELTGPEYAEKYINLLEKSDVDIYLNTTVVEMVQEEKMKFITAYSGRYGVLRISCRAIILAMGCRERNRGNLGIAGTRPSGIFTAGFAQRLINIDGYVPGKNIVIIGSGDIGLIMARRCTWIGSKVHGVVEILSYPSGLSRNISQCLNDFHIPLYLAHTVTRIYGKNRVEGVDITPLSDGVPDTSRIFSIECDTILLSVGLIPENELSKKMGIPINTNTGGPYVDAHFMTGTEGVFACGNVLHVHDLVDFVSEEARTCAGYVYRYLQEGFADVRQGKVAAGSNVIYVVPNKYAADKENVFYLRPFIVKNNATLTLASNGKVLKKKKLLHIQPSEMIRFTVKQAELKVLPDASLEISIQ